jgi:hypothetical protein
MQYTEIFPTLVAHDTNLEFSNLLLPVANDYLSTYGKPHRGSNHITTYHDSDCAAIMAQDKRLHNFFDYAISKSREYLDIMNVDSSSYRFNYPSSFFAKVGKDALHETHTHPNSIISGVFYLTCSDDVSPIIFTDPRSYYKYIHYEQIFGRKNGYYLYPEYVVKPKPGMLLLFPSWLEHEVPKQTCDDERITLVFNLDK